MEKLSLKLLHGGFAVCKLGEMPQTLPSPPFSLTVNEGEISLVAQSALVPDTATAVEDGWRALRVCGCLDFGLVGVLSRLTGALATANIPVFAISTFDTDYILVKNDMLEKATSALITAGYIVDMS